MSSIETLRFVLLGDDRASSAFSQFARNVDQTTRAVGRNNLALGDSKLKLDAIQKKAVELGRLHPDLKVNIDDAAAKLKLAVLKQELRSIGNGPDVNTGTSGWATLKTAISGIIGTAGSGAAGAGGSGLAGAASQLPQIAGIGVPAFAALAGAAALTAAALTPVAAALLPITLGFGTLAAFAGPEVVKVFKAMTLQGTALKTAMKNLSPAERDLLKQLEPLRDQFGQLRKAVQPEIMTAFGTAIKIVKDIMPALKPLVIAAGKALDEFLRQMSDWLSSPQGKSFTHWLGTVGPRDIINFGRVMWDVAKTVGQALNQIYRAGSWIDRFVTRWHEDWILVKNVFTLIGDQLVIFALRTVQGILTPFTHIPGIGGQFTKARDAVHGELVKMVGDARQAGTQITNAFDAIQAKPVALTFSLNLPAGVTFPSRPIKGHHAAGTSGAAPGWAWTGEKGPELVHFRGGETVLPSHVSMAMGTPPGYAAGVGYNIRAIFRPPVGVFDKRMTSLANADIAGIDKFVQNNFTVSASFGGFGGGGLGAGPGGSVEAVARALFPWPSFMWAAFNAVEMREAGYSLTAQNPTSGAYGVAQFINGPSEYYSYGGNPFTAAGQFTAMFNYIRQRYGNPLGAWAHELNFGWYDQGGYLPPGLSMAYNGTGRPEPVSSGSRGPGDRGSLARIEQLLETLIAATGELIGAVDDNAHTTASGVAGAIGGAAKSAHYTGLYGA
jgi:hypothetical protein